MQKNEGKILCTPLGEIEVAIDGEKVDYGIRKLDIDKQCSSLNGRYAILVDCIVDTQEHTVSCRIKRHRKSQKDFVESRGGTVLKSFCKGSAKLSIGTFGELSDGWCKTVDATTAYRSEYLNNGVQYHARSGKNHMMYPFGVAWVDHVNDENKEETRYGADPTIWWNEVCHEQKLLFCCVKQEIDKWDPYGFFPDAPPDEYDGESRKIVGRIMTDSSVDRLAENVAEIFTVSFGADARFTADYCKGIAGKIEHRISKYKNKLKNGK